jgi:hypothetical protein
VGRLREKDCLLGGIYGRMAEAFVGAWFLVDGCSKRGHERYP